MAGAQGGTLYPETLIKRTHILFILIQPSFQPTFNN